MPQDPFDQTMNLALLEHRAGRFFEAEKLYRQIISQNPDHGPALHMLGVLAKQAGNADAAVDLIQRAIKVLPPSAEMYVNLGGALLSQKNADAAIGAFSKAVQLGPELPEGHCGLGAAYLDNRQFDRAISACNRAIAIKPAYSDAHNFLGTAMRAKGQLDAAIAAFSTAVQFAPNFDVAFQNLGSALREKGRLQESITALRRAVQLKPKDADALNNLGLSLTAAGETNEAIGFLQSALQHRPQFVEAMNNLAIAQRRAQQLDDAVETLSRAVELWPDCAHCLVNLGNVWKDKGEIGRAIACFRQALLIDPTFELAQSNICYAVYFDPDYTAEMILAEHREWAKRFAEPRRRSAPAIDRSITRRLKIGYVSPDLRGHVVGRFLLPLLQHHDKQRFEIHGYSDVRRPDSLTARLRSCCDGWHETAGLSDETLAERIRADGIDILVDLTLHMEGSRLLMFARKPAPVQVTWLGYAGTTGLSAMDFRLGDPVLDPPGSDENYVEKTVRIPTYWCYAPIEPTFDVGPLPANVNGYITFGAFNDFSKVSPAIIELWAQILHRIRSSKLLIHALPGSHRERMVDVFARAGVDPSRIEFVKRLSLGDYLHQYNQIDIALDTTPYGGGTTTCDSLWMGVPVVTLRGKTAVGRGGASLLGQLGLESLIAETPENYVEIAVRLAGDLQTLSQLRGSLRQQMLASPLMDGPRFARSIESAFLEMWRMKLAASAS
jgi:predicted O-linked N-acetylglucosamine transferase (SPINDLY family)